eukprot:TRINITY_DN59587_c0_g1_i1.p1 TRINITY_DN59587_c0_g1~~TRINITY_DN59587_c0_g1_i1.p1  ORF type:complete len:232 (-),score=16.12 TRINITY_DN59587_c0_g1_i1:451-1146(-)
MCVVTVTQRCSDVLLGFAVVVINVLAILDMAQERNDDAENLGDDGVIAAILLAFLCISIRRIGFLRTSNKNLRRYAVERSILALGLSLWCLMRLWMRFRYLVYLLQAFYGCCGLLWLTFLPDEEEEEDRQYASNSRETRRAGLARSYVCPQIVGRATIATEAAPCCICLVDINSGEQVSQLACGHMFHAECIEEWVFFRLQNVGTQNRLCPMRCLPHVAKHVITPDSAISL